jgi:hypothetical protein
MKEWKTNLSVQKHYGSVYTKGDSMKRSSIETAFSGTTRVAYCSMLLSTCKPKTPPQVVPPAVEESTEIDSVRTESEPPRPEKSFPENFAECRTELERGFGAEEEVTDLTKKSCDEYAQHLNAIDIQFGVYHSECCDVLAWMGSRACTPWEPPVLSSMGTA